MLRLNLKPENVEKILAAKRQAELAEMAKPVEGGSSSTRHPHRNMTILANNVSRLHTNEKTGQRS